MIDGNAHRIGTRTNPRTHSHKTSPHTVVQCRCCCICCCVVENPNDKKCTHGLKIDTHTDQTAKAIPFSLLSSLSTIYFARPRVCVQSDLLTICFCFWLAYFNKSKSLWHGSAKAVISAATIIYVYLMRKKRKSSTQTHRN